MDMSLEEDRIELSGREFEHKLYRLGSRPGFLVRAPAGWELSTSAPCPGSGPYFERLSNGLVGSGITTARATCPTPI
jgi:hypothetical protein